MDEPKSNLNVKNKKANFSQKLRKFYPVLLFLPLIVLIGSDSTLVLVNQVLITIEFNLEDNFRVVGGLASVSQVALAISAIFGGYLADRFKRKNILIACGLMWAIGEFMVYLSPNIYWMYVFRILGSLGAGGSTPVTMSLLSDIFSSENRGNSFAWWGLATTVGGLGGASIAFAFNKIDYAFDDDTISLTDRIAFIKDHYPMEIISQWRIPFLIMAILGIFFTVLLFLVKEPKRGSSEEVFQEILANADIDYSNSYKIKLGDLKYIYTRKSNLWLIINFVDTIFFGFLTGFLITWLTVEVGISTTGGDLIIIIPFFILMVGLAFGGQFLFAKMGDNKVKKGDPAGRVKVAILCGIAPLPLLGAGFNFYPNFGNRSFFRGALDLSTNNFAFGAMFIFMGLLLGVGLGFVFGVSPNWYSSMMDVNLPEHRGTMIATASFMDALGRAIGAFLGGMAIDYYNSRGSIMPISDTIVLFTLTFGILSSVLWLPILKYCKKDFREVVEILSDRAKHLKQMAILKGQN